VRPLSISYSSQVTNLRQRGTATKLATALDISLDYLVGNGDLQVFDKGLLKRIEDLSSLPDDDRKGILFALDGLLRDAKARVAYQ